LPIRPADAPRAPYCAEGDLAPRTVPAMLISILIALVIAGVILWALGQFPIDPTLARIIRVVVIVVVVLYCLGALTGRHFLPGL
jgi:ABC-type multidrug transport system permease subunit